MNKLSIILPCYNEQSAIEPVLTELIEFTSSLKNYRSEIIVINDGSTDHSLLKLRQFSNQINLISNEKNEGYGAALKKGIEVAEGDYIAFYDFDNTCVAKDLKKLITKAENGFQVVSGARLHRNSKMPYSRKVGNFIFKKIASLLIRKDILDLCSGYRMFKKELKPYFLLELPEGLNFTLAMTILSHRAGFRFSEISINYNERTGSSKLNVFKEGFIFLASIFFYSLKPLYPRQLNLPISEKDLV